MCRSVVVTIQRTHARDGRVKTNMILKKKLNEYDKQAQDFLEKVNVDFRAIEAVPQTKPTWAEEGENWGMKWEIYLTKYTTLTDGSQHSEKQISFPFWSSVHDNEVWEETKRHSILGLKFHPTPRAYDVLAGLLNDTEGGFEDFCADYGYDTDSRRAEKIYHECIELNAKLKKVFNGDALRLLSEIY